MAPRLRPSQEKPRLSPIAGMRARRLRAQKRSAAKGNTVLFAQLFGLGAAFMLSFGYFSNSDFRQSVSNGFAAILPAPPAVSDTAAVKQVANSIDPFAPAEGVATQQPPPVPSEKIEAAKPEPVAVLPKPVAVLPKSEPLPPPVAPAAEPLPAPAALEAVEPAPVVVDQPKAEPAPIPPAPLPKPDKQVAAVKTAAPEVAAPEIVPAAEPESLPAATPVPAPIAAPDPAVLPATEPAEVAAAAPAPVAPPPTVEAAPAEIETPVVVAASVPPPLVKIQVPEQPAKIQNRIEASPVPTEKTAEQLVPQRTPGEVIADCEKCPKLVVVAATPDDGVLKAVDAKYSGDAASLAPFAIGEHEITFDDWDRCVSDGGCSAQPSDEGWGRGQRPVIHVSFNDINEQYIPWLSRTSNHQYRLPSEAEWEFAVRGGASANPKFAYSFGDDEALLCDYGNSSDLAAKTADSNWAGTPCNDSFATTAPVGSLKPNPLGIFDMHGNVWEWVSDCLRSGYSTDPAKNEVDCNFRVLRGGSWASPAPALRSTERGWERPDKHKNSIGFRVARSLP
jgi:hypothetical protein